MDIENNTLHNEMLQDYVKQKKMQSLKQIAGGGLAALVGGKFLYNSANREENVAKIRQKEAAVPRVLPKNPNKAHFTDTLWLQPSVAKAVEKAWGSPLLNRLATLGTLVGAGTAGYGAYNYLKYSKLGKEHADSIRKQSAAPFKMGPIAKRLAQENISLNPFKIVDELSKKKFLKNFLLNYTAIGATAGGLSGGISGGLSHLVSKDARKDKSFAQNVGSGFLRGGLAGGLVGATHAGHQALKFNRVYKGAHLGKHGYRLGSELVETLPRTIRLSSLGGTLATVASGGKSKLAALARFKQEEGE